MEEEDPGEASGGDAAPYDDGRGEQRPVAVDHPRFLLDFSLSLASLQVVDSDGWRRERRWGGW